MDDIVVIGAGAMGCLYGGLLAQSGRRVTLLDLDRAHVEAIERDGLRLDGVTGDLRIPIRATADPGAVAPAAADLAIVLVDANATRAAAETARGLLRPDGPDGDGGGFAVTLQNGIGNVEALAEVLGPERVVGGVSFHSALRQGPGHVTHTHAERTWIGELDGRTTPRLERLAATLAEAGFTPVPVDNVQGTIWGKFVLNCSIIPICAITGLRLGELVRTPEVDAFQDRILEEALAVVRAKGITLPEADPRRQIKEHCWRKFSKPSMLQHVEQGKRTEIDALNGALVREGRALGVPTPYNEALTAMIKGYETHRRLAVHGPAPDYDALERAAAGTAPPAMD